MQEDEGRAGSVMGCARHSQVPLEAEALAPGCVMEVI